MEVYLAVYQITKGRVPGAYKENKRWIIPADAVKPADKCLKGDELILYDTYLHSRSYSNHEMRRWNKQERNSAIWKNKSNAIIDIDCGAGYPKEGGQLGCLRLNDMKEFYVRL